MEKLRDDRHWQEIPSPTVIATWNTDAGVQQFVVRLDTESVAAIRDGTPLPDVPTVVDQNGVAMVKAEDGTWHYVVRLADDQARTLSIEALETR